MKPMVLFSALALLVFATACAPRSMTLSEARGLCFTYSTGGGVNENNADSGNGGSCGDTRPICEGFLDEAVLGSLNRDSCLAACEASRRQQNQTHLIDGCSPYTKRAYELCDLYCRGK